MVIRDLAPSLVVDDPDDDAGVALVLVDHDFELPLKLLLLGVGGPGIGVHAHRRHVLDDQEPESVAGFVEEVGLDLDVLANHVHAQVFDHVEVVDHGLECRRGVEAIRPISLVLMLEILVGESVLCQLTPGPEGQI
jgi:hypothetical protein